MTQLLTAHESSLICQYIWYTVTWSVWIIYWAKEYKECGGINGIFNPFFFTCYSHWTQHAPSSIIILFHYLISNILPLSVFIQVCFLTFINRSSNFTLRCTCLNQSTHESK